jgi:uncharacterized protein YbcV (DUF1398 family)
MKREEDTMDDVGQELARACLRGAETDTMTFPDILGALGEAGFEGYAVDFRSGNAVYHRGDGACVSLAIHADGTVAPAFDAQGVLAAIREAQSLVAGYTYAGFCRKIVAAGCAGYLVSLSGRRALYWGRTGETHVERFPDAPVMTR